MRAAVAASLSLHLGLGGALVAWGHAPAPPQTSGGWMDVVWLPARDSQPSGAPGQVGEESQSRSLASPMRMMAPRASLPVLSRSARNRPPAYPDAARRAAMQGTVALEVRVGPNGTPQAVTVARSSGFALLDDAARGAVLSWVFQPALHAGMPVVGVTRVGLRFSLVDSG
jgi:protein TonB